MKVYLVQHGEPVSKDVDPDNESELKAMLNECLQGE